MDRYINEAGRRPQKGRSRDDKFFPGFQRGKLGMA